MKNVYLDNNATTQVAPEVIKEMMPFLEELWGNPSSMHFFGGQVQQYIELARAQVAELIGAADPSEIVFTSCGTESNNMAIYGLAEAVGAGNKIITTRVEHPAVLATCRHFKEHGHEVAEIGVNGKGDIDLDELKKELATGPAIVSTMWANNETGVIFPIDEICKLVKDAGGILHTDAVQAVGKLPINVSKTPIDILSLSGHKIHAPKGIGAIYIKKGTKLKTFMTGGHQERGRRAGTENVPYIVALGKACNMAKEFIAGDKEAAIAKLRDKLEAGILKNCLDTTVNGNIAHRLPNTTNISFQYIEGESILYHLSDIDIAASSGSACTSGSLEPSHVIRAMGVPFTSAHGSTRFSLSRYTTEEEIDYTIENMPSIVNRLREMSPFV